MTAGLCLLAGILAVSWGSGAGCGSSGDGSTTPTSSAGGGLNDAFDDKAVTCTGISTTTYTSGSFSVAVSNAPCVNASSPAASAETALPAALTLDTNDKNATAGAAAYTMTTGGLPFITTDTAAVTVTVPFDPTVALTADSTHVFLRILDTTTGTVTDVTGTISGNTIVATIPGLPTTMTVAVIYNANMRAVGASTAANTSVSATPGTSKTVTSTTWPASQWCVVYDPYGTAVESALKTYTGSATPTLAQRDTAVQTGIAGNAVKSQNEYVAAGFRAPNLVVVNTAADPCGASLGTTARFLIHYVQNGNMFRPNDASTKLDPDGNHYGALYISADAINWTRASEGATVYNVIAHEMLHGIQNGYEIYGNTSKGYREGTATCYGETLDSGSNTPQVRSLSSGETFKFSNFLTANTGEEGGVVAYSNQDFFVYVARKYNSNSLRYLAGLFEQMHTGIEAQASAQADAASQAGFRASPSRPVLFDAMDTYFNSAFSKSLKEIYLDFLKQRIFDHNTESRFGRSGEATSGFVPGLFETSTTDATKNSLEIVQVNAGDCAMTGTTSGTFGGVGPFAARAIRVAVSKVAATSTLPTITVTLTPNNGSIGNSWDGYSLRGGSTKSLSGSNTFSSFGAAATDEIDIAVANVVSNQRTSLSYEVKCEGSAGDSGTTGTNSTFTLDTFTPPGQSLTPRYVVVTPDVGTGVIVGMLSESTDLLEQVSLGHLQVQLSTTLITGAGTYTIVGDDPFKGPAAILYSPTWAAATSGAGKVYTSTTGTLTITAFGTTLGSHITGSFTSTVSNTDTTPATTGSINGTFDFVVGSANAL